MEGRRLANAAVRSRPYGLLVVILITLVVRLGYLGLYYEHARLPLAEKVFRSIIPSTWEQFTPDLAADRLFSDQKGYDAIARNLLAGRGYRLRADGPPTAFRAPGYPLFLAAIYATGGNGFLRVRLAQVLLEIGTVLLLVAIGRRVFGGERAALAGAALYGVYLPLVFYAATLFSETFYTFVLALFVYVWLRAREKRDRRWPAHLFAGALLGLATLTKPTTLLFPLFLVLPIAWRRDRGDFLRRQVRDGVLPLALGMMVVLTPWTVRNQVVLGEFIPVTTGGGRVLWGCNYIPPDDPMIPSASRSAGQDSPEADRRFYGRALENVVRHPGTFARASLLKLVRLWFNLGFDQTPSRGSLLLGGVNLLLVLLLAASLLFFRGAWVERASPLFLLLVYFSLIHMVLEGYVRYALPAMPYLMLPAAHGMVSIWQRLPWMRARPA